MPEYVQRNVMALALETMLTHGADPTLWPVELQAANSAAMAKWRKIEAIRAASNQIEAMSPIPADFRDDSYWQ